MRRKGLGAGTEVSSWEGVQGTGAARSGAPFAGRTFLDASELSVSAKLISQILSTSTDGLTEAAEFIAGGE